MITTVGFDGDDTLWHTENAYAGAESFYQELLARYLSVEEVKERLFATEMANLSLYGYGVKSFVLSMIETALAISGNQISAGEIAMIVENGKTMLEREPEPIDGAEETLRAMAAHFRLLLITKGDLIDQESKLAQTGMGEHFHEIEIVSAKDEQTYTRVLKRHRVTGSEFVMVGNSVRSDVLPAIAAGACAVHVPYNITWAHEAASSGDLPQERFREVRDIRRVPEAIAALGRSSLS